MAWLNVSDQEIAKALVDDGYTVFQDDDDIKEYIDKRLDSEGVIIFNNSYEVLEYVAYDHNMMSDISSTILFEELRERGYKVSGTGFEYGNYDSPENQSRLIDSEGG
jgi:hypothetical protein